MTDKENEIRKKQGCQQAYCSICKKIITGIWWKGCHECDEYSHESCALENPAPGYEKHKGD